MAVHMATGVEDQPGGSSRPCVRLRIERPRCCLALGDGLAGLLDLGPQLDRVLGHAVVHQALDAGEELVEDVLASACSMPSPASSSSISDGVAVVGSSIGMVFTSEWVRARPCRPGEGMGRRRCAKRGRRGRIRW